MSQSHTVHHAGHPHHTSHALTGLFVGEDVDHTEAADAPRQPEEALTVERPMPVLNLRSRHSVPSSSSSVALKSVFAKDNSTPGGGGGRGGGSVSDIAASYARPSTTPIFDRAHRESTVARAPVAYHCVGLE